MSTPLRRLLGKYSMLIGEDFITSFKSNVTKNREFALELFFCHLLKKNKDVISKSNLTHIIENQFFFQ